MDYPFDPRALGVSRANPHNEFGRPMPDKPPQVPWGQVQRADWVAPGDGTTVWTWRTPIFDFRPEYVIGSEVLATAGVPINHQGTYGIGNVLQVIVGGEPANQANLSCVWWELGDTIGGGNPATMPQRPLLMLSQPDDITAEMLAGGLTTATEGEGGTLFQFDPPGCRFWQVVLQFTHATGGTPALHVRATLGV